MKFGERLKNERLNQHLTQDQVSKDFFVSRQTISSWENEKTYPDINSLIKLSNYYHISLDTLLKEDHGMREYLEKKDVSYHLKPIRTSLLGMTLILSAILMCNFFNLLNLDSIINSLILILSSLTIVALNSLNKFDKNYQLSLQESWQ